MSLATPTTARAGQGEVAGDHQVVAVGHKDATGVADVAGAAAAEIDKDQRNAAEDVHNAAGAAAGSDSGGLADSAAGAAADAVGAAAAEGGMVEAEGGCATLANKAS